MGKAEGGAEGADGLGALASRRGDVGAARTGGADSFLWSEKFDIFHFGTFLFVSWILPPPPMFCVRVVSKGLSEGVFRTLRCALGKRVAGKELRGDSLELVVGSP